MKFEMIKFEMTLDSTDLITDESCARLTLKSIKSAGTRFVLAGHSNTENKIMV